MKLIKPSFEIIEQESGLDGLYKHIERCGRLSYRSEDKITEESAKPFIDRLINMGHLSVLEHGTVYLKFSDVWDSDKGWVCPARGKYIGNSYSKVTTKWETSSIYGRCLTYYVTSNMRVLIENGWEDDLKYLCEPTEYHEPRISVKFTCSRSISHELVRHRVFSFIQESQRYCSYNKGKFGEEITYIIPSWSKLKEGKWSPLTEEEGRELYKAAEDKIQFNKDLRFANSLFWDGVTYMDLISEGCKPQEAREVLPNATKTEIIMTGFLSDWWGEYLIFDKETGELCKKIPGYLYNELDSVDKDKYRIVEKGFFPLRCSLGAHPSARELALPLREEFIKRGWMND